MFEQDPRYSSQANRSQHFAECYAFVAGHIKTRTSAEWLSLLTAADIPVMPLNSLEDLLADPHLDRNRIFFADRASERRHAALDGRDQPRGRKRRPIRRGPRHGSASTAPRCCAKPAMPPRKSMR